MQFKLTDEKLPEPKQVRNEVAQPCPEDRQMSFEPAQGNEIIVAAESFNDGIHFVVYEVKRKGNAFEIERCLAANPSLDKAFVEAVRCAYMRQEGRL